MNNKIYIFTLTAHAQTITPAFCLPLRRMHKPQHQPSAYPYGACTGHNTSLLLTLTARMHRPQHQPSAYPYGSYTFTQTHCYTTVIIDYLHLKKSRRHYNPAPLTQERDKSIFSFIKGILLPAVCYINIYIPAI